MRLRTRTALGIDLGASRISVALVERGEQGFRTIAAASDVWPVKEATPQESAPGKVLSRLLSQLGRRSQIRRAPVAVALSADSMVMQLLDMPGHVPTNIGEFVKSELQQYVALSGKNVISDFCGVGAGVQKRVLAVAADVDEVQETVTRCSAAGIAVDVVEPSVLAYARAFLVASEAIAGQRRCDDRLLGPRTLTIHLFLRGTLDFVRVRNLSKEANTPPLLCAWLAEELKAVTRYYDTQAPQAGCDRRTCMVVHDGVHTAGEIAPLLTAEAPHGLVHGRGCVRTSARFFCHPRWRRVAGGRGSRSHVAGDRRERPEDQSAAGYGDAGAIACATRAGDGDCRRRAFPERLRHRAASGADDP